MELPSDVSFDTIKNDLLEKGYHIGASGHVIINAKTFQQLHTITPEEEALFDAALKSECERAIEFSKELTSTVNEVLPEIMQRSPEEIKRDIKHEKNPMRLKQLNRELNMSYKFWRKKSK